MSENRKIYSRRKLHGLKESKPAIWEVGKPSSLPLSVLLDGGLDSSRWIALCGPLAAMTREYCEEPLGAGWEFALPFTFKHRTATYRHKTYGTEKTVRLISHREGWFPGCEDADTVAAAYVALASEWTATTGLPLLSSPSKTGQAYLWEMLPKGADFPSLPADVEKVVRANSPQHRIEQFVVEGRESVEALLHRCYQYDGRWMYANLCTIDRLPIGEPRKVGGFKEYQPGWYHVNIRIPENWNHIGLIPKLIREERGNLGWEYPSAPGSQFVTWASEPELTLAVQNGWEIMEVIDGYAFDKGRPLLPWASALIQMRERLMGVAVKAGLAAPDGEKWKALNFAASAVRQILNHAIGSLHARGYERELFVSDDDWRMWRRENAGWFDTHNAERVKGGRLVSHYVPDNSPLSINMSHWSATIWALERERIARAALKCDPSTLVKINGDAIYSTERIAWIEEEDKGRVGQLRRKDG